MFSGFQRSSFYLVSFVNFGTIAFHLMIVHHFFYFFEDCIFVAFYWSHFYIIGDKL